MIESLGFDLTEVSHRKNIYHNEFFSVITPAQAKTKSADNKIYSTGNDVTKPKLPAQSTQPMSTLHPKPIRHQVGHLIDKLRIFLEC